MGLVRFHAPRVSQSSSAMNAIVTAPENSGIFIETVGAGDNADNGFTLMTAKDLQSHGSLQLTKGSNWGGFKQGYKDGVLYYLSGIDTSVTAKILDIATNSFTSKTPPSGFEATDSFYGIHENLMISITKTNGVIKIWNMSNDTVFGASQDIAIPSTPEFYDDETFIYEGAMYLAGTDKHLYKIDMYTGTVTDLYTTSNTLRFYYDTTNNRPYIYEYTVNNMIGLDGVVLGSYTSDISKTKLFSTYVDGNGDTQPIFKTTDFTINGNHFELEFMYDNYGPGAYPVGDRLYFFETRRLKSVSTAKPLHFLAHYISYDIPRLPVIYNSNHVVPAGMSLYAVSDSWGTSQLVEPFVSAMKGV